MNEFIENINEYATDANDLYKILTLKFITIKGKKVILSKLNEGLSNISLELSENLLEIVSEIVMSNKGKIEIGIDLYWEIFDNMSNQEKKINLLSYQSRFLKEFEIKESLDKIGKPFSDISYSPRARILYSECVLQLANSLVERRYISSKSIKSDKKTGKEFIQFNQFTKRKN